MSNHKPSSSPLLIPLLVIALIFGVLAILLAPIWLTDNSTNLRAGFLAVGIVGIVAAVIATLLWNSTSGPSEPDNRILTGENGETLGQLIDVESEATGDEKREIQGRLTTALNAVQIHDGNELSVSQMEKLYVHIDRYARLNACSSIAPQWNAYPLGGTWERPKVLAELVPQLTEEYIDFLLSVLTALGRIGDEDSIKHVNAILAGEAKSEQVERVQHAAEECLAEMEQNIEARRLASTLIRPSTEPVDPLLRPAQTTINAQPEVLLRSDEHR
jgi:hypothetical protein